MNLHFEQINFLISVTMVEIHKAIFSKVVL